MRRAAALFFIIAIACAPSGSDGAQPVQSSPPVTPTPTAPPPSGGSLLRFAVIGDFGNGSSEQHDVAFRMCAWRKDDPFNFVVTTGDNIYDAGEPEYFESRFFRPYRCLLNDEVRFRAVLGNHDVITNNGRPEIREPAFGIKSRNYVVRKNSVRFVMWESTHPNMEWLREHLGEQTGDRWTIVSFHHPVFTPGPHGNTAGFAPSLPRLFRRKGVDLVLNGHDHLYGQTRRGGIPYVVTGGGGARLYGCDHPENTDVCIVRHHFLYVVAGRDRIVVRAVPASGRPFHNFATEGRS